MKEQKRVWIVGIILVALLVVASQFYQKLSKNIDTEQLATQEHTQEHTQESKEKLLAPDFTVYDKDGNEVHLKDYIGKPIVINFWASWCGPCQMEMPDFQEKYEELQDEIQFLMVNMTDGARETVEIADTFIAKEGYTFPVFYDTKENAAMTYQVYSLPTTFFIDAQGYVIGQATGAIDGETLQRGIDMITTSKEHISYRQVSSKEAMAMMEQESDYIILDVRTEEEYEEEHIVGAINIPNEIIGNTELIQLQDKDQFIFVYCRSGNRSKQAAEKLVNLGYTNVVEFGGIYEWQGEKE